MKTIKNVMLAGLLMIGMAANANERFATKDGNVTITKENEVVNVSILNTQNATYQLIITSEDGAVVYKGWLGNNLSLGKAFDFQTAEEGTYTFKLVSKNGASFEQDIKIG